MPTKWSKSDLLTAALQVSGGQVTGLDGAGRSHRVELQYGDFGETGSEIREICKGTNSQENIYTLFWSCLSPTL